MSAHKYSSIELLPEVYHAITNLFSSKIYMKEDSPDFIRQNEQTTFDEVKQHLDRVSQREDAFNELVTSFNPTAREVEEKTSQGLRQQAETLIQNFQDRQEKRDTQFETHIDQSLMALQMNISNDHHTRQQEISRLRRKMAGLLDDEQKKADYASEWVTQAQDLLVFIGGQYDHEQFAPDQLNRLANDLALANQNLEMGLFEAALVNGQTVYQRASELRIFLEGEEKRWQVLFQLAIEKLQQLSTRINNNTELNLDDDEDNQPLSLAYWSKGGLDKLVQKLNLEIQTVNNPNSPPSREDLLNLINHRIPDLNLQFEQCVDLARKEITNSQIRINIADLVLEALSKQGYNPNDEAIHYIKEDQREAYIALAESIDGNSVEIRVNPGVNNQYSLELINHHPENQTEHEMRRRSEEISLSLRQHGVKVDRFEQIQPVRGEQKNPQSNSKTSPQTIEVKRGRV